MLGMMKRVVRPAMAARRAAIRPAAIAAKPASAFRFAPTVRAMSTAAPATAKAEEAAVVVEEPKGGLLNRGYELYPLLGLGAATAITQEWWIIDEYWITGSTFGVALYAAYVLGYDSVVANKAAARAKNIAQTKAAFGIRLDMLKRYQALEEFSLSHPAELRNLYEEEAKINELAVEYQNLKHKHDTRNAIVQKLNSLKVLEEDARGNAISALAKKAAEYVTKQFAAAPTAVKSKHIETGIASIVPELTTRSIAIARAAPVKPLANDDPVKMLFDEFLATPRTLEELGVQNAAKDFMERQKQAAAKKH